MDVIIVLAVAVIALILLLWYIARNRGRVFTSSQFTAQTVMHNFASEDRKAAIEEVQFVQEDEARDEEDGDPNLPSAPEERQQPKPNEQERAEDG